MGYADKLCVIFKNRAAKLLHPGFLPSPSHLLQIRQGKRKKEIRCFKFLVEDQSKAIYFVMMPFSTPSLRKQLCKPNNCATERMNTSHYGKGKLYIVKVPLFKISDNRYFLCISLKNYAASKSVDLKPSHFLINISHKQTTLWVWWHLGLTIDIYKEMYGVHK